MQDSVEIKKNFEKLKDDFKTMQESQNSWKKRAEGKKTMKSLFKNQLKNSSTVEVNG